MSIAELSLLKDHRGSVAGEKFVLNYHGCKRQEEKTLQYATSKISLPSSGWAATEATLV